MIKKIFFIIFITIFCCACQSEKQKNVSAGGAGKLKIKIGVITGLTGLPAAYGEAVANGCKLAVKEINAGNEITVELKIEDSAGQQEQAMTSLKKLINVDRVSAILGPLLSTEMKAIGPEANFNGIPILATSNTAPGIPQIGEYVFRNSIPESLAVPAALKKAVDRFGIKKVVLFYGNDDVFTKSSADVMKQAAEDLGLQMLTIEYFQKSQTDYKPQLTKIKSLNPDAILCSALYNEGAVILQQARKLGLNIPVIGGNGFNSPKIIEIAKEYADGLIVATPWFTGNKDERVQQFIANYETEYKIKPDQFAAQAYDGIYLLAKAAVNAGSDNRKKIRNALAGIHNFEGVLGKFAFDGEGDVVMEPLVITIKNGEFRLF